MSESARDTLHFATEADGAHWVRGRGYKARFGPGGATYIPFLGSSAPRNLPLELSLASATVGGAEFTLAPALAATREGDRLTIDRGAIDEVYAIALDHVEQMFVIEERPAPGDLELFVRVAPEFEVRRDDTGFELRSESGSVHYGSAFARMADGSKLELMSDAVVGGIRITVGAGLLADAQYPLVIDPVVSTFSIDTYTLDQVDADLSYDLTTDKYLTVWREYFSGTDGDVWGDLRDASGGTPMAGYLDLTDEDWQSPQAANLNQADQFLCVVQAANVPGSTGWVIRGKTVQAADFSQGAKFNISGTDFAGDKILPDVGGDPYEASNAYYCVTWHRTYSATIADIHARIVRSDSTFQTPTIVIDGASTSVNSWPAISESNGRVPGLAAWTIAWHRQITPTNYHIYAARLSWDGVVLDPLTPLVTGSGTTYFPRVSSPTNDGRVLLTFAHDYGTDHDLEYLLLIGTSVQHLGGLTVMDSPLNLFRDQIEYSCDTDGSRFVVAYAENTVLDSTNYNIHVSAFADLGTSLALVEGHAQVDTSPTSAFRTDIVSEWGSGGGDRRFRLVYDEVLAGSSPQQSDIFGADYDYPNGGAKVPFCAGDFPAACPCSNPGSLTHGCANSTTSSGAAMLASGTAATGALDTLQLTAFNMTPNAPALMFQGTGSSSFLAFGDGRLCTTGSIVRFGVKFTNSVGSASWPSGLDPALTAGGLVPTAGGQRFYQVYYRDAAPGHCTSATFNLTSGMQVYWLP